jgi:ParB-like chromosome segregation protein Spo0J
MALPPKYVPSIPYHGLADAWPMLQPQQLKALADSIDKYGQKQPIVLVKDMVLDGRNRLAACDQLGIKPKVE